MARRVVWIGAVILPLRNHSLRSTPPHILGCSYCERHAFTSISRVDAKAPSNDMPVRPVNVEIYPHNRLNPRKAEPAEGLGWRGLSVASLVPSCVATPTAVQRLAKSYYCSPPVHAAAYPADYMDVAEIKDPELRG